MNQMEQAKQAKTLHSESLLTKPNVVGVGIGYKQTSGRVTGEVGVVVMVRKKIPMAGLESSALVPLRVEGVRTDVLEVGDLRPLQQPTDRWRPAPGGTSIGHYKITAGTLGSIVRDRRTGQRLILSNNHVLANSNEAQPGDPVLQPGSADGGVPEEDTIAHLERFCPIDFGTAPPTCSIAEAYVRVGNGLAGLMGSKHRLNTEQVNPAAVNLVDAAVAAPLNQKDILDEILEIGVVSSTTRAVLGLPVRKSGRTTGYTTGEVLVLDATVEVQYGLGRKGVFEQQIVTEALSRGGDSGSLLVEANTPRAVGLLFAGSDQATIHNPIQAVLDCLDIEFSSPQLVDKQSDTRSQFERAQAVKQLYETELLNKANVIGVGMGLKHIRGQRTDAPAIVVMVTNKVPGHMLAPEDVIPHEIEGIPVDVKEIGDVEAQ
jgi:hypothetical protein